MTDTGQETGGLTRRDMMRRGAIVGGVLWAAPVVQSLGSPAAAVSPAGCGVVIKVQVLPSGTPACFDVINASPACCQAIIALQNDPVAAIAYLITNSECAGASLLPVPCP